MYARFSKQKHLNILISTIFAGAGLSTFAPAAHSGENFMEALTGGKPSLSLRYRYEDVDQ